MMECTVTIGKDKRMTRPGCVCHDRRWSSFYQHVLNKLRSNKMLPTNGYFNILTKALCLCGTEDELRSPVMQQETVDSLVTYFATTPPEGTIESTNIQSAVKPFLKNLSPSDDGRVKFLMILKEIANKDLNTLAKLIKAQKSSGAGFMETFRVQLPKAHLGLFIGKKGGKLQHVCFKYKCNITIGESEDTTEVTITAKKEELLKEAKQALEELAKKICDDRIKHEAHVKFYKQMVTDAEETKSTGRASLILNVKEAATQEYERQVAYAQSMEATRKLKLETKAPGLQGGHCGNCLQPYRASSLPETNQGSCKHHPGFIAPNNDSSETRYKWTCCGTETFDKHANCEKHLLNGCASGIHNWRRGDRSPTKKQRMDSDAMDIEQQ